MIIEKEMRGKISRRKKPSSSSYIVYAILGAILLAYLVAPIVNLVPAAVVIAHRDIIDDFSRPEVLNALGVSFLTASVSACIAAFFWDTACVPPGKAQL